MESKAQWETPKLSHFGDVSDLTAGTKVTKVAGGTDNCFAEGSGGSSISCIA